MPRKPGDDRHLKGLPLSSQVLDMLQEEADQEYTDWIRGRKKRRESLLARGQDIKEKKGRKKVGIFG